MLGLFRYLLAMMVVLSHLWPWTAWWQGTYAVFGFYVISGYLMTLVLNGSYSGRGGWKRYGLNRLLRIFPPYLFVLLLSLVLVFLAPGLATVPVAMELTFGQVVRSPDTLGDWFANLTLVLPWSNGNLAVSQAWSLRIELVFYALMIPIVTRRKVVFLWLAISLAFIAKQELEEALFIHRYTSVAGSSVAFALGSLIWHCRDRLQLPAWQLWLAAFCFFAHAAFAAEIWHFERSETFAHMFSRESYGLYASTVLAAWLLAAIVSPGRGADPAPRWSEELGNLAYPIFLCHWLVVGALLTAGISFQNKFMLLPLALVGIHALAFLTFRGIERPINLHLRRRLRDPSS